MATLVPIKPDADDHWQAVSTSHLLHRAQQLASDRFAFLVGEDGVTLRQFVVMTAIAETPGMSQIDLVRATGIDRSTLADMVTRLERRGWVARKASTADARANALDLTESGVSSLQHARAHAKAADAAILDALPKTKRKPFLATLLRLSDHADKIARDAEREAKRHAKREAKLRARERKKEMTAKASAKAEAAAVKTKPPAEKRKPRRKEGVR